MAGGLPSLPGRRVAVIGYWPGGFRCPSRVVPVRSARVTGPSAPGPDPSEGRDSLRWWHHLVRQGNFLACFSRAGGRAAGTIGSHLGSRDTALRRDWLSSGTAGVP